MCLQPHFLTRMKRGIDQAHELDWVTSTLLSQPVGYQLPRLLLDLGGAIPEAPGDESDAPLNAGRGGR